MSLRKQTSSHPGPLAGVRVVEFGGIGPAPFATMLLADLGADVVRIDRVADLTDVEDDGRSVVNRGKRSLVLDLKNPRGIEIALGLIEQADVVVECFRPGVTERLGLGPESALARNPRIVYGRMTGWGQHGPKAHTAGHDLGYIAGTGLLHAIGGAGAPSVPLNLLGDYAGGAMYLVTGVLAALHHVTQTGTGQVVDAAISDGTAHLGTLIYGMLAAGGWRDERAANLLDGGAPFYDVYQTADGGHLTVAPIEPKFYAEFARLAELPEDRPAQHDRDRWDELREVIAQRIKARTLAEWTEVFSGTDACVEPVLSLREAFDDEHANARQAFIEMDGVIQPAPSPRFSVTPGHVHRSAPMAGADTAEVLEEWGVGPAAEALESGAAYQREGVNAG
ncbi:carnitine dehydratase [Rhodococcus sp. ACS1]|uniref:CaiB/BaiF CoA transferase family protein n=1 Tax=Rhodococcus sp. ACS1 TaxID=2028570 RepID=UPI000BB0F3D8|nr:CaiB/BaiF CoA-transferase family protein [Rhodococcus sp. ACS1]PBC35342.1 carnitine dehydratase [Rhodococcus sp. ACS1]